MRIIQAFTLQRTGFDAASGILDWMLSPIYAKRAHPSYPLVLYTNMRSVIALGKLWPYIAEQYDEVYTNLSNNTNGMFSAPKFEAMTHELQEHGSDFIIIDNDMYLFPGALFRADDYCIYYDDGHLMPWYRQVMNGYEKKIDAPDWMNWTAIPYNCAVIRLNNKALLQEYIDLFYRVKAENIILPKNENELARTMIKEQWVLGELLKRHRIKPAYLFHKNKTLHKGNLKPICKPTHVIIMQEYLASWLAPKAFVEFKEMFKDLQLPDCDINWCFDTFLKPFEKEGLLSLVKEAQQKCV